MASVPTTKTGNGQLPPGFLSPFKRQGQLGSHDDLIAIVAMLTEKPISEVFQMAHTLGMRKFNYWVDDALVKKLLFNLSTLTISEYKEFTSVDALADVCILCVDYEVKGDAESSRHVLYHAVQATPQHPSFRYVIDPSPVEIKQQITTEFGHLNLKPSWFLTVSQRPNPAGTKPK